MEPKFENNRLTFGQLIVEQGKLVDVVEVTLPFSKTDMLSKDVANVDEESNNVKGNGYLIDTDGNEYLISEKTYNFIYELFKKA